MALAMMVPVALTVVSMDRKRSIEEADERSLSFSRRMYPLLSALFLAASMIGR